jgi:hypothetical protein
MEVVVAKSIYYHGICLKGLWKPRKASARIASVPVEIRTERLPTASPDRHHWLPIVMFCFRVLFNDALNIMTM